MQVYILWAYQELFVHAVAIASWEQKHPVFQVLQLPVTSKYSREKVL